MQSLQFELPLGWLIIRPSAPAIAKAGFPGALASLSLILAKVQAGLVHRQQPSEGLATAQGISLGPSMWTSICQTFAPTHTRTHTRLCAHMLGYTHTSPHTEPQSRELVLL